MMEAKNNARWETGPREQIRFIKHTCHFDSQACGVVLEWLRMLYDYTTNDGLPAGRGADTICPQPDLKANESCP